MNKLTVIAASIALLATGIGAGYFMAGSHQPIPQDKTEGAQPLYWYDPMKPEVHFDKPGKSPFMDMDLVPKYADAAGTAAVRIDAGLTQNTGLKIASAVAGQLQSGVQAAGSVVLNDRDVAIVQARTSGIVERVYQLAAGDVIAAGRALADVRVPEWLAAQNEYLVLRRDPQLGSAAKSRLLQLGMSSAQIAKLEQTGVASPVVTISAPRGGVVAELMVRQGMMLQAGEALARINGLASVWIEAEVPEAQIGQIDVGSAAQVRFAAWPNEPFGAKVSAILPVINTETRTVRVRLELPNPKGKIRPGMYAQIALNGEAKSAILVPSDAVIATGKRKVIITSDGKGAFVPVEVQTGATAGGQTEIVAGLNAGEQVVVSGQFLIDSEASLRGVLARMGAKTGESTAQANSKAVAVAEHFGTGEVKKVSKDELVLAHDPIASLNWPSMTMPFDVIDLSQLAALKVGDKVEFTLVEQDGAPKISRIAVKGKAAAAVKGGHNHD
ncbi:efflux RND transporter periplasmic adaptor subunit [Chitinibacter sp. SCUT-21]|uniref:efflux RND transporter periplasmic adaptor subunit n=1 Tax=Chitinibacter sp. SCUT-21 TaxID=2970891 RepID=UPI0035A71A6F